MFTSCSRPTLGLYSCLALCDFVLRKHYINCLLLVVVLLYIKTNIQIFHLTCKIANRGADVPIVHLCSNRLHTSYLRELRSLCLVGGSGSTDWTISIPVTVDQDEAVMQRDVMALWLL